MAKGLGDLELFYVATTAPTTPADKDDAAYNLVANLKTLRIGIESNQIDGSDKDSGRFGDPYAGDKNVPIEGTLNRDYAGNAGQQALRTAALATDEATSELWWIATTGTTGNEGKHGKLRMLNYEDNSDKGAMAEASFSAQNIGAFTVFIEA